MLLEMAIEESSEGADPYNEVLNEQQSGGAISIAPLIKAIVGDLKSRQRPGMIAARFHRTLVELFIRAAVAAREKSGISTVGLSGGVFQNVYLFELMVERLQQESFRVLTHQQVPANDGGLALGQVVIADALTRR